MNEVGAAEALGAALIDGGAGVADTAGAVVAGGDGTVDGLIGVAAQALKTRGTTTIRDRRAERSWHPARLGASVGGGRAACHPQLLLQRCSLRRHVTVDVQVEAAGIRTGVPREAAVGVLRAALLDVGAVGVRVPALAEIRAGDEVPPVSPDTVRERSDRADVEVVAAEGERATAGLLPVGVARDRTQPGRRRPGERRR